MEGFLRFSGSFGLLITLSLLIRSRAALKGTTLTAAWSWSIAAILFWTGVWIFDVLFSTVQPGLADRLWYVVAVLIVCPPIVVLGSRRPTTRVWPWFVILPLFVVLLLPVVSTWRGGLTPGPLELETPVLIGMGLVLIMGAGNYVGTRFTIPALLYCVAVVLLVVPLSAAVADVFPQARVLREWATLSLSLAALFAGWRRKATVRTPYRDSKRLAQCDRLWLDFRDLFGIVWARRIQDRINAAAVKEQWPARLDAGGVVWTEEGEAVRDVREVEERIAHTFRWLLRRFVDPQWIDNRLGRGASPPVG